MAEIIWIPIIAYSSFHFKCNILDQHYKALPDNNYEIYK